MKKLYYSFVIGLVGLLGLFTANQLSSAQNNSRAAAKIENQPSLNTSLVKTDSFEALKIKPDVFTSLLPPGRVIADVDFIQENEAIFTHGILDGSGYEVRYFSGQSTNLGGWWQGCQSTPMTGGTYDCDRRFNYGTFTLAAPAELDAVHVWIGGFNNWGLPFEPLLKLEIYQGDPASSANPNALLATSNPSVVGHSWPTGAERTFTFETPVSLGGNIPYTFRIFLQSGIRGDFAASGAFALYGVTFMPTPGPPPVVFSILPTVPVSAVSDQDIFVSGSNFKPNLMVEISSPDGIVSALGGEQIQNVTETSFIMRPTFSTPGNWSIKVRNPDNQYSQVFPVTVSSGGSAPFITSITPTSPTANGADQNIVVTGGNFQNGLKVNLTFPGGGVTTLQGTGQIQDVTGGTPTQNSVCSRGAVTQTGDIELISVTTDSNGFLTYKFLNKNSAKNIHLHVSYYNPAACTPGGFQTLIVAGGDGINIGSNESYGVRQISASDWQVRNFTTGAVLHTYSLANINMTGGIAYGTYAVTAPFSHNSHSEFCDSPQAPRSSSFKMKAALSQEGSWKIRVVNPDNAQSGQFPFSVLPSGSPPTGLPTTILSPVIGPLRVTSANMGISDGKWEFNQHKTGYHRPTGGISLSNDTYAWDINQYAPTNLNEDAGKPVFATAAGQVVSYVGTLPGGGPGAVLIAHPSAANPIWFSGYLHLKNVRVTLNQIVDSSTLIGEVGRSGADNDHLHFVVYSGTNTRGNLRSFNAAINERGTGVTTLPTITSITPNTVNQSDTAQQISINGTDFQSDSIVEAQVPDGQKFTITPETTTLSKSTQILRGTSTSITVRVPFVFSGTYKFTVINRSTGARSSGICPQSCVSVSSAATLRTPVILIPGIMGSRLAKLNNGQIGEELWIGDVLTDHIVLKNNVEDPAVWKEIPNRQVVATQIMRKAVNKNIYGDLIDYLTSNDVGYKLYSEREPTINPCNTSEVNANADLFVFPYDWRNSNITSAKDLYNFIQCIGRIRYGNNPIPASFKVDIVAHSMGGLVARRYILNNPSNHHVDRMLTLGTPWLGAPKFINTLENGGPWLDKFNFVINPVTVKAIAPYLKGAHELIPSSVYTTDLANVNTRGIFPLGEDGWNDYDDDSRQNSPFTFGQLKSAMNKNYSNSLNRPGDTADTFHSQPLQDDWRADNTGVTYYHFIGSSSGTIGSVIAKYSWWRGHYFETVDTDGDGTVPNISATKKRGNIDFNPIGLPSNRFRYFSATDHTQLVAGANTYSSIKCVIRDQDPNNCLANLTSKEGTSYVSNLAVEPHYKLRVDNSESVIITDSLGNTTDPLSTSLDEGLQTVKINLTGDKNLEASFPLDQNYQVVIKTPSTPLSIILTKNDGQDITQAIRYVDIILPANVLALIQITPQGVTNLSYDSNGDGTFDTPVNPTIVVNGAPAQDMEPPSLIINENVQGGNSRIDLVAADSGTGVQKIMYSVNGATFQQYSTPLTLNAAATPTIYAFADDNVFNRSGLVTLNLTTSNSGFGVSGPGSAPAGGIITANWNAPSSRPADDWIGLFRVGTLNSAYISKQYTGGLTTGSLSFTLPNQNGTYEFRYLINDGYSSVAVSSPIVVNSSRSTMFDFDGDSKSDVSIFRPTVGEWWYLKSSDGGHYAAQFGNSTDKLVPGDYTGDGKTDIAIWRPSTGEWFILRSEDGSYYSFPFGISGDMPAPGDYDGDGKADQAVFRPSDTNWYIRRSSDGGFTIQQFGTAGDVPVVSDYDGDGKSDIAIWRASVGQWWIQRSTAGTIAVTFGNSADKPVQGDYTGDGKADVAIWRPASGEWFILRSEDYSYYSFPFGTNGDVPAPGDYDGDGLFDATVFRPSGSTWYVQRTTAGTLIQNFGQSGDRPVPNAFIP